MDPRSCISLRVLFEAKRVYLHQAQNWLLLKGGRQEGRWWKIKNQKSVESQSGDPVFRRIWWKKKKPPPCSQKCVFLLVPTDEYWNVTVLNDTRAEFDTGRLFFHINCWKCSLKNIITNSLEAKNICTFIYSGIVKKGRRRRCYSSLFFLHVWRTLENIGLCLKGAIIKQKQTCQRSVCIVLWRYLLKLAC